MQSELCMTCAGFPVNNCYFHERICLMAISWITPNDSTFSMGYIFVIWQINYTNTTSHHNRLGGITTEANAVIYMAELDFHWSIKNEQTASSMFYNRHTTHYGTQKKRKKKNQAISNPLPNADTRAYWNLPTERQPKPLQDSETQK